MDLFSRLKALFNRNKPKQLPEGRGNELNMQDKQKNSFLEDIVVKPVPQAKEPTIDDCVLEFINRYAELKEFDDEKSEKLKKHRSQEELKEINDHDEIGRPYRAFTRMFCEEEEPANKNEEYQKELYNYISKNPNLSSALQVSGKKIVFMHIQGKKGIDEKLDTEMEKLYINCDRQYISEMTKEILNKIEGIVGDKLQMKIVAEQMEKVGRATEKNSETKNYQRFEKIVIYSQNRAMTERIAEQINELRNERPEMFSSKKTIPLMPKKYGFIGVSSKKPQQVAKTPLGYACGKTYNDFLSDILYQSVIAGFDKKFDVDYENETSSSGERMSQYISIFNKMSEQDKLNIVYNCSEIFEKVCREYKVNTIYTPVKDEQDYEIFKG